MHSQDKPQWVVCVGLDDAATVLRCPGGALAARAPHRDEDGLLSGGGGWEAGEVGSV